MNSKSALLQQKIRYQKWAEEVKECENRPANVSIRNWCEQKGIKPPTYYAHLHKVKELCLDLYVDSDSDSINSAVYPIKEDLNVPSKPMFVELPMPTTKAVNVSTIPAVTISVGKSKIEISEDISDDFLKRLLGALNDA